MEGGFNKALLMTEQNGKEVAAEIPCGDLVPSYSTASETATLEYVRSRTSVPVPRALSWNSHAMNTVGVEYIVMEKAQGKTFGGFQYLIRLESELASVEFPGYGNLYFRHSAQHLSRVIPLNDEYCIGPAYNAAWFPRLNNGDHAGPWENLCSLGLVLANRGLKRVRHSDLVLRGPPYGSKDEHIRTLETALKIIPILAGSTGLQRPSKPRLWHGDLHLGNIFICNKNPTNITSMIDWQYISIMPTFTQVQRPSFLVPPDDYKFGTAKPELPPNYDEIDSDEKAFAIIERDKALLAKSYEAALAKNHLESYLVFTRVDPIIRHSFALCENTSKDGILPLCDFLVQIYEYLGPNGPSRQLPLPSYMPRFIKAHT
ncbi:hypothetical protein BBP40_000636 [Aspergillus hancockii]|nr:hypothetical protein BBP40_000636 [Aspergillus hancockii]